MTMYPALNLATYPNGVVNPAFSPTTFPGRGSANWGGNAQVPASGYGHSYAGNNASGFQSPAVPFNPAMASGRAAVPPTAPAGVVPQPVVVNRNFYYSVPTPVATRSDDRKPFSWKKFFFTTASVIAGTGIVLGGTGYALSRYLGVRARDIQYVANKVRQTAALLWKIPDPSLQVGNEVLDCYHAGDLKSIFTKVLPKYLQGDASKALGTEIKNPDDLKKYSKSLVDSGVETVLPGQNFDSVTAHTKRLYNTSVEACDFYDRFKQSPWYHRINWLVGNPSPNAVKVAAATSKNIEHDVSSSKGMPGAFVESADKAAAKPDAKPADSQPQEQAPTPQENKSGWGFGWF